MEMKAEEIARAGAANMELRSGRDNRRNEDIAHVNRLQVRLYVEQYFAN
jgi:hypothetical protein